MSVTIYLTDHRGKQIAFFYRIDSERYNTAPSIIWACRQHPEYQGRAESKEHFIEQAKDVMRELNRNRSCDTCGLTSPKMESQLTCPQCLITDKYQYLK
jgi:rubrerythrin